MLLLFISPTTFCQENLTSDLKYFAQDSIIYDLNNNKVFLYKNANVNYNNTQLNSSFISIDFNKNILYAIGTYDTLGNYVAPPILTENEKTYKADTIIYNYKTKKAKITKLLTEDDGGYLHGQEIKKEDEKIYYLRNGKYTTCELEEPHFFINAKKLKLIAGEKIITGPANLILGNLPTPLIIPFGIFPINNERSSGIIMPTYGESATLGYHLRDLGYHFSINEYLNLSLIGDIYTKGSWRIAASSMYKKRYKFNGSIKINYATTKISEPNMPNYSLSKDFKITWQHKQDPKLHPNQQFSALLNLASSTYNLNNAYNADYLQNTLSSNISFQKSWENKPYNLSINMRHNQNTINKQVDITMPELLFSVNRLFPFKNSIKKTWYKNLGISYSLNGKNTLSAPDSLIFNNTNQNIRNGIKHSVPISTSFNMFKYVNINPAIQYTERWYFTKQEKIWDPNSQLIHTDTLDGFWALREFKLSTQINTKIYGFFATQNKQFRHVLTPSLTYMYKPDFSNEKFGIYSELETDNETELYSYFQGGIYGVPSSIKQNLLNINLNNNLEMKINKNGEEKKIKIIENLSINGSYNNALDSLQMSNININLRTKLFNKLNLKLNSSIDPYKLNSNGLKIDELLLKNGQIGRLTNLNFDVSFDLNNNKNKKESNLVNKDELDYINENIDYFVDFSVPWSLKMYYNFTYNKPGLDSNILQSINFNGDINITKKWKIGFRSGYDLKNRDFTYTSIDIYRDLHCWEMTFNWIPMGFHQSYNFVIRVKSAILQDLKLTKKKSFYDY
ncbi:MAG: hypothetical protein CMD27_00745 [Flavobacteriales bacterium]|mgnify:CR=1 FL=1|nr:hypothetical protein [Flavobacteriales bacterium]|tara:strand:- start:1161 stop:3530 length:2370 start_codon:yes stop_codon:yes gene_type:complete